MRTLKNDLTIFYNFFSSVGSVGTKYLAHSTVAYKVKYQTRQNYSLGVPLHGRKVTSRTLLSCFLVMGLDGPGPVTDANITVPPENQTNKCHNVYIKIMQKRI